MRCKPSAKLTRSFEMKQFISMFFVALLLLAGCSNIQRSSVNEAKYIIEHEEDFGTILEVFQLESGILGIGLATDPVVRSFKGDLARNNDPFFAVHAIVYRTKNGRINLVFLSDTRPPKIVKRVILENVNK